jgi:hypothetical protein
MDDCQTLRRNPPSGQRVRGHTAPRTHDKPGLAHDSKDHWNQPNDNAWDGSDDGSGEDDAESDDHAAGSNGVVTCNTKVARESACNPSN